MMRVGIVIVSYNTCGLLRDCLLSVYGLTHGVDFGVAVVDNGSSDGSPEMVRGEFPQVVLVETGENLGFGRANNRGVEALLAVSRTDSVSWELEYLFFLNPDTVLENNAVKILADYLDGHSQAGIVGGNLYDGTGAPAQSFSPIHGLWWELIKLMPEGIKRWVWRPQAWFNYSLAPREVGYISGADLMVRRAALCGTLPFDPDFFMYYEDMELCVRVRRLSGLAVVSVPQARIVHLAGQACSVSRRRFAMLQDAKYLYFTKVHGIFYARLVYLVSQGGYRAHAWLGRVMRNHAKRDRYAEWAQINGAAWRSFRTNNC